MMWIFSYLVIFLLHGYCCYSEEQETSDYECPELCPHKKWLDAESTANWQFTQHAEDKSEDALKGSEKSLCLAYNEEFCVQCSRGVDFLLNSLTLTVKAKKGDTLIRTYGETSTKRELEADKEDIPRASTTFKIDMMCVTVSGEGEDGWKLSNFAIQACLKVKPGPGGETGRGLAFVPERKPGPQCNFPEGIANGRVSVYNIGTITTYAAYSCNKGYTREGSGVSICLDDGVHSDPETVCVAECLDKITRKNKVVHVSGKKFKTCRKLVRTHPEVCQIIGESGRECCKSCRGVDTSCADDLWWRGSFGHRGNFCENCTCHDIRRVSKKFMKQACKKKIKSEAGVSIRAGCCLQCKSVGFSQ